MDNRAEIREFLEDGLRLLAGWAATVDVTQSDHTPTSTKDQ